MPNEEGLTRRNFLKDVGFIAGGTLLATTALSFTGCGNDGEEGGTKYACLWCGETFSTRDSLMLHIQITHPGKGFGPIPVGIMLSSIDNQEQLKRRVDELIKRNFLVSIHAGGIIDNIGSDYVKELSQAGFDIANQAKIDTDMSYDDKLEQTRAMKEELELLLGTQVKSYSSTSRFIIDHDTINIISALGGGYIQVSSLSAKHPDQTLEPELIPDMPEDIAVAYCWQQSRGLYNEGTDLLTQDVLAMSGSNCDDSAQSDLDGPQWAEFEKSLIDQRVKSGKPLTLTFHCDMDVKGKAPSEQWFEAFVSIIDYLKEQQTAKRVQVMSLASMINLYFPGT